MAAVNLCIDTNILIDHLKGREPEGSQQGQEATVHEMEQLAIEGLKKQVGLKNPYEFQDLAAAILRGMGYHTPFVALHGRDGGVDIIAYRDPLGTVSPRIKAQIKHRPNTPATVQEVRQLMGLLQKDGDVGIFVSSGGFTPDAKTLTANTMVLPMSGLRRMQAPPRNPGWNVRPGLRRSERIDGSPLCRLCGLRDGQ